MMTARKAARSYHHGDLPDALLEAAERILETEGVQALTLRATARAVGVSHTAPQNHFDDLTGLLSELAAVGFQRFAKSLTAAGEAAGPDPRSRSKAIGRAYVRFAQEHKGLFVLMFRSERLDSSRPALRDAIEAARAALRAAAIPSEQPTTPLRQAAAAAAQWSLVHGFAVLLTEGRFAGLMQSVPGGVAADDFLEAALDSVEINPSACSEPQDRGCGR